ncbi:MAG: hypothetical protein PHF86_08485 [Candidatus Nanoarchaeia archaeon]|jgi:hypothetical protein|nr:hypothetical protein [Candidatus Nanoarchaeia archaeon]
MKSIVKLDEEKEDKLKVPVLLQSKEDDHFIVFFVGPGVGTIVSLNKDKVIDCDSSFDLGYSYYIGYYSNGWDMNKFKNTPFKGEVILSN